MNNESREALRPLFLECFDRFASANTNSDLVSRERHLIQFDFLVGGMRHYADYDSRIEDELKHTMRWMDSVVDPSKGSGQYNNEDAARGCLMQAWSFDVSPKQKS
jgi:hypothetical protein